MSRWPDEPSEDEVVGGYLIYRNGCVGVRLDIGPDRSMLAEAPIAFKRYLCALQAEDLWRVRKRWADDARAHAEHMRAHLFESDWGYALSKISACLKEADRYDSEAEKYRLRVLDMWTLADLDVPPDADWGVGHGLSS